MSRTTLLGNLPLIKEGANKNRLDRVALSKQIGFSIEEIYKAYNNWIQIFRIKESTLTFEEYLYKMKEAGIRPVNLGNENYDYHLSRYTDDGPYTKNSCRFILKKNNLKEQVENGKNTIVDRWSERSKAYDF